MRADLDTLIASRPAAGSSTTSPFPAPPELKAPLPALTIDPAGAADPGRDVIVTARVAPGVAIRSARLRYRHVTQYEDYASVEMTRDGATLSARIPGAFVTPAWDVMYFIEVVTVDGRGRNYPDLDRETPYVVLSVRR